MLMPALPLLIALFVAFAAGPLVPAVAVRPDEWAGCLVEALGGLAVAASVALGLGLGLTVAVRRRGLPAFDVRRGLVGAEFLVQAMNLVVYTWLVHEVGWPEVVRAGLGLRGVVVLDELAVLLPFLVLEVVGWSALFPAARAARFVGASGSVSAYLVRRARLAFGMVLPLVVVFWAARDLSVWALGDSGRSSLGELAVMAALGVVMPAFSPALIRLARPSSPLPPGPLRDRLERLSRRFGFRFSDILVWDTEGSLVNAGVAGALPWFRYVMLSDALIDRLDEHEVAAVFGHEMGHVRHRHIAYIGLFLLGSLGVLALAAQLVDGAFAMAGLGGPGRPVADLGRAAVLLGAAGVYYRAVFGALSRRFECQADLFGGLAVSCGRPDCGRPDGPPHAGYDASRHEAPGRPGMLCPVGVAICANALETVALENGHGLDARSWRYESMSRRVAFLRGLLGRPLAERDFQLGVSRLRLLLALMLASAVALAIVTGAFESLRGL